MHLEKHRAPTGIGLFPKGATVHKETRNRRSDLALRASDPRQHHPARSGNRGDRSRVPCLTVPTNPCPRDRQPEGRRRQDHDGDQSRHGAGRERLSRAADRPRSAGQCLDRSRHPAADRSFTSYDLLFDPDPESVHPVRSSVPGLDIIPATADLSSADVDMVSDARRIHKMQDALATQAHPRSARMTTS